jgi:hypothetical protein
MNEPKPAAPEDWQALDRILNQQTEINQRLRRIIEPLHKSNPDTAHLTGEVAKEVADLVLEMEVIQAEERALLNHLFPEAEFWIR